MESKINIKEFNYILPEHKIAKFPLPNREDSKLLVFKNSSVSSNLFSNIHELLPNNSELVINNTKVVAARLIFQKKSGAFIEIFCLEPIDPFEYNEAFSAYGSSKWKCVIGNIKRFKDSEIELYNTGNSEVENINLRAELVSRIDNEAVVWFKWNHNYAFSSVLDICGNIPIPPYLKRESVFLDKERYQTVYAHNKGSVAAPTAGLHFTEKVLEIIKQKGININELSLHVGAGTFIPVKSEFISDHKMHSETFTVKRELVEKILDIHSKRKIISVGTTTVRSLESLYYLGKNCIEYGKPGEVTQWEPYNMVKEYSLEESLSALLIWFHTSGKNELTTKTQIIILPGFKFRIVDILITNFHQPKSTLLLLIAAFIGNEWKELYNYALENDFRFLSYGDSCLFFRK